MAGPRVVYTPLIRKNREAPSAQDGASSRNASADAPEGVARAPRGEQMPKDDPFIRAENEDDDGYDPYSDRREETPLFEENPWS